MTAAPSLVFTVFSSRDDRRFRGWWAFRQAIEAGVRLGAAPVGSLRPVDHAGAAHRESDNLPAASPDLGIWRLLASNNRELARGWSSFPSLGTAREELARLQASVRSLEVSGVRGETATVNGWVATLEGEAVISCGRWFSAASTSMHSARTALAEFAVASLPPTPLRAPERAGPTVADRRAVTMGRA